MQAHTSESDELEEEDESLELSDAMPVDSCRSTLSARAARSGRSCFRTLRTNTTSVRHGGGKTQPAFPDRRYRLVPYRYHFLDSLGRPRTVLCHTMGKLVVLAKFWVTAIVVSRLRTTCHHPPADTRTVNVNIRVRHTTLHKVDHRTTASQPGTDRGRLLQVRDGTTRTERQDSGGECVSVY